MALKPRKITGLYWTPAMATARRIPENKRCKTCINNINYGQSGICSIRKGFVVDPLSACTMHELSEVSK